MFRFPCKRQKISQNISPQPHKQRYFSSDAYWPGFCRGYWKDKAFQRRFMDELGQQLDIKHWKEWNKVNCKTILENGGGTLLNMYNNSPFRLLQSIYPEPPWDKNEHRVHLPKRYWDSKSNQRKFMDELGQKLNIKQWQDWRKVPLKTLQDNGATGLLHVYSNSPFKLFQSVYPEYPWDQSGPRRTANGYWRSLKTQRKFMDELGIKLNITHWTDWNSVSRKCIADYGGHYLAQLYGTRSKLLRTIYPEHDWSKRFTGAMTSDTRWKSQSHLSSLLKKILPEQPSEYNFRYPDLRYNNQGCQRVQIDVFFPSLSLAFEYQGESHYYDTFIFTDSSRRTELDQLKMKVFPTQGITLVAIPFWWDKKEDSLVATIRSIRPDIKLPTSSTSGIPISEVVPPKVQVHILKQRSLLVK